MKKYKDYFYGFLCGVLNGLFGAGGGVIAVPCLEKSGLEQKKAHASSVALIFILSLVTFVIYLLNDRIDFKAAMDYIPYGFIGAVIGTALLKKMPGKWLRKAFALMIIAGAIRIMFT